LSDMVEVEETSNTCSFGSHFISAVMDASEDVLQRSMNNSVRRECSEPGESKTPVASVELYSLTISFDRNGNWEMLMLWPLSPVRSSVVMQFMRFLTGDKYDSAFSKGIREI
jgi:hypothetical protein